MTPTERLALIDPLVDLAREAGEAIMAVYRTDFAVTNKSDNSPVTEADRAADAIITAGLAHLAPNIFLVSEEQTESWQHGSAPEIFFIVDPLDGTREFVNRRDDFTVNIALIEQGVPTLGIVYTPVRRWMLAGEVSSATAWQMRGDDPRQSIRTRHPPAQGLTAVASSSHDTPDTDAFLAHFPMEKRVAAGSSLKFGLLACGEADLYPRLSPTCEWDTAAGDAVLRAAGGCTLGLDGLPLAYGKPDYFNPGFISRSAAVEIPPAALAGCKPALPTRR